MRILFGLLIVALAFSASQTMAAPLLTITTEHWPPNNYLNEKGELVGKATDKVHRILTEAGVDYQIKLLPWARAYHMAMRDPNTGVYSIMRTEKREKHFRWVCPIIGPTPIYVFKLTKRKDIVVNDVDDLKNYMISVSRSEFDHQFLETHGFVAGKDFDISFDDEVLVRKLLNGRIEVMLGTERAVNNFTQKMGFDTDYVAKEMRVTLPTYSPTCLAFSLSTSEALVERIRQALIRLNAKDK